MDNTERGVQCQTASTLVVLKGTTPRENIIMRNEPFVLHSIFLFFFFKFIYFDWRLITLQYCIGFAIYQYESTTGVHVFIVSFN